MIDEVSNTLGWDRKHTLKPLKALNRQVSQVSQVAPPAAASIQWNLPPTLKRDREGSSLSLSAMKKTVRKKSNELASLTPCDFIYHWHNTGCSSRTAVAVLMI